MTIIIVERVTAALRGTLTRWMLEARAGVFVGTLSSRVREKLWELVQGRKRLGACMLIARSPNEQGFSIATNGSGRRLTVDYDGLTLFKMRSEADDGGGPMPPPDAVQIAGAAGVGPRTVAAYLAGKNVRPRARERIERAMKREQL